MIADPFFFFFIIIINRNKKKKRKERCREIIVSGHMLASSAFIGPVKIGNDQKADYEIEVFSSVVITRRFSCLLSLFSLIFGRE